jgi:hypothetical protein
MPGALPRLLALAVALLASLASATAGASGEHCTTSALALRQGPRVVPHTMELPVALEIVNDGHVACTLAGYPHVALLSSSGAVYPFAYRDGGDVEVTGHHPATVTLRPKGAAFVLINKSPCIASVNGRLARQVRLTPPGGAGALTLRSLGGVFLDYCGMGDPGHHVDVSPVEASLSAAEH